MYFIEVSAKSGNNVNRLFRRLARSLAKRHIENMKLSSNSKGTAK